MSSANCRAPFPIMFASAGQGAPPRPYHPLGRPPSRHPSDPIETGQACKVSPKPVPMMPTAALDDWELRLTIFPSERPGRLIPDDMDETLAARQILTDSTD